MREREDERGDIRLHVYEATRAADGVDVWITDAVRAPTKSGCLPGPEAT